MLKVMLKWIIDKIDKEIHASDAFGRYFIDSNYSEVIICPVSRIKIREAKYAGAMLTIDRKKYYFCTYGCKTKFVKNPEQYLNIDSGENLM